MIKVESRKYEKFIGSFVVAIKSGKIGYSHLFPTRVHKTDIIQFIGHHNTEPDAVNIHIFTTSGGVSFTTVSTNVGDRFRKVYKNEGYRHESLIRGS